MKQFQLVRLSIVFCFLFFLHSGFSQKRIAIIGSSSANGYFPASSGYPKDSAWAYKIKKYYKDLGVIDTLFNIAQSSTDCFEGMPSSYVPPAGFGYRLPNPNINITRAVNLIPKPDVIIVNYPSNSYDWIPNEQVLTCLQTIKDSANAKNIKCYITTTQPRDGFSPSERLKLKTLRDLILARFGEWAIDFFTEIAQEPDPKIKVEYAIGDGVHLNPAGHTVLKNKVIDKNIFFGTVPVKFSGLNAVALRDKVQLQWNTLNEINNRHFSIEKSVDGVHYHSIGITPGRINSSNGIPYTFADTHPANGQNYYRIVAVSMQDQKEFSSTVLVKFTKEKISSVLISYTNNLINVSFKEVSVKPAMVNVFNMQGKLILQKKVDAYSTRVEPISTSTLVSGKYIVQVLFENQKETFQFVKY